MSAGPAWRVEAIRTVEGMERLEPEWRRLWWADARATPFQSPEWLLPWWRSVGEGELCGAAVRDGAGCLIGLLPMYVYTQPGSGRRDRMLLGAGTSDYLGGVFQASAGCSATEVAEYALGWAERDGQGRCDGTTLHQMRGDSPVLEAARRRGLAEVPGEGCSVLSTDCSVVPAKMRLNMGRYRRRAEGVGELRSSTATTPEDALSALERLIGLHTRRWEKRGETGVLAQAAVQAHHRAAVPLMQAAGLLRMTTLFLGQEPLGVLYSLADPVGRGQVIKRRWYGYLIGIEAGRSELSPGTLLIERVLREAAEEGVGMFDMLRGGEQYKRFWGAHAESTFSVDLQGQRPERAVQ